MSKSAFSVQDAQSAGFSAGGKPAAPLFSISMDGKGGGYTYIIRELPQSKPVGFASSLRKRPRPLRR